MIHKDTDVVNAFCVTPSNDSLIAVAVHKEILEMDISSLLKPPAWTEDDAESDEDNDA